MQKQGILSPSPTLKSCRRLGKWGRFLLVVTMLLFALAGWWWASRPKTYRLVGRYPLADTFEKVWSTTAGFLVKESARKYVMHDWATGRECWRVSPAKADFHNWPGDPFYASMASVCASISPDGRNLYIATPAGDRLRVQFWQTGCLMGEALIPLPDSFRQVNPKVLSGVQPVLFACDSKRCFVELIARIKGGSDRYNIYALNGQCVEATNELPQIVYFSPDGQTARFHYYKKRSTIIGTDTVNWIDRTCATARVSIEKKKLLYRDKRNLPDIAFFGVNGTAITQGGEIFRLDGTHDGLSGSWMCLWKNSVNGRYAAICDPVKKRVCVVNLITGQRWNTHVPGITAENRPTADGQAFIAHVDYSLLETPLGEMLEKHVPAMDRFLRSKRYFILYRKHERLVARLRLDQMQFRPDHPDKWHTSPDGRSIILLDATEKDECLLYRY